MSEQDKHKIQELLSMVIEAIDVIQSRSIRIKSGNDFLLSPDNMFILDGVCMKLIFIGESIKTIDKISKGEFLSLYPSIPWSSIMKQRDLIAHHYFRIDADSIYATINQDLPILLDVLQDMIKKLE
jgi:uncharacterized protein with HEPN domain